MRLLFLTGRDIKHPAIGGGDIQGWEWARYAVSRGHQVTYVCSSHPGLPAEDDVAGIRIHRLGRGALLLLRTFAFYRRRHQDFDLVYEDVIGGRRPPYLSPLYVKKPIVAVWHQPTRELLIDSHGELVARLFSFGERQLARLYRNAWVAAHSHESRSQLSCELGLPLERIRVVPCSIPDEWLAARRLDQANGQLVLCVSNIRRYKGIHTLLRAFSLVRKECEAAQLVIVGRRVDSAYETSLRRLAEALGLSGHIQFQTSIGEEEKKALLCRSRVLVLPSRREGFGIVVLEANACGVPVVASSGVPESVVKDGRNGLRYHFGDIERLAQCVVRLLRSNDLYHELSENSLVFARHFRWSEVGRQFEDLIQLAIHRGSQMEAVGRSEIGAGTSL